MSGKTVNLVVDPHGARVIGVENDAGASLGNATPLDLLANLHRVRRKPEPPLDDDGAGVTDNPAGGTVPRCTLR